MSAKYQIIISNFDVFDVTHVKHKEIFFEGKMLLKLHFEVLYRRLLFLMSISVTRNAESREQLLKALSGHL